MACFRAAPGGIPNLHDTTARMYATFCRNRTAGLYATFFTLIGDEDYPGWLGDATYTKEFIACAPFHGKKDERAVSGGMSASSRRMHGVVRYEYKKNVIEEGRREGKPHGLRVVCTETGHVWIRLHVQGRRIAQVVLNSDMSVQSTIDDGGLNLLRQNLHLIKACFEK